MRVVHVIAFSVQVTLALFTATTGSINLMYHQWLPGALGLIATPLFLWFARRHHRILRDQDRRATELSKTIEGR